MRSVLDIDEDVLEMAGEIAANNGKSLGCVISGLARTALKRRRFVGRKHNGVPVMPIGKRCGQVTLDIVNRLRDWLVAAQP